MADIRKKTGSKGVRYQVRYPSAAAKSGYAYKNFRTMKEARAFLQSGEAQRDSSAISTDIRTVHQAIDRWLEVCEKEGRGGRDPVTNFTLKTYQYRAQIMKSYNWPRSLHALTSPDVVAFRSWLLQTYPRDLSRKVLSSFHSMVIEMVTRGILRYDVAAGVQINTASRYDNGVIIPTEREVSALLSAADRLANSKNQQVARSWKRYRPMLYLAIDSGMRPQEYVVLPGFNIETTGVLVDRALERGSRKISVTKTRAGRRFIEISSDVLAMIKHYRDNEAPSNPDDLVFPTAAGKVQSLDNWRKRGFRAVCEEAGLMDFTEQEGKKVEKPKYTLYHLRHFYASMLIESRANLKRIQSLMGHSDIQTTLNVYGHLIERAENCDEKPIGLLDRLARK